jgi:hypothetical protein
MFTEKEANLTSTTLENLSQHGKMPICPTNSQEGREETS